MSAFASVEELREFLGGEAPKGPRAEMFLDHATRLIRAHLRMEPEGEDRNLCKMIALQVAGRAITRGDDGQQFGPESPETVGFAPRIYLLPGEMWALANLTHLGVG